VCTGTLVHMSKQSGNDWKAWEGDAASAYGYTMSEHAGNGEKFLPSASRVIGSSRAVYGHIGTLWADSQGQPCPPAPG
jgi:hypothetical protein